MTYVFPIQGWHSISLEDLYIGYLCVPCPSRNHWPIIRALNLFFRVNDHGAFAKLTVLTVRFPFAIFCILPAACSRNDLSSNRDCFAVVIIDISEYLFYRDTLGRSASNQEKRANGK